MNAMNGLKNALNDCTPLVHFAIETEPALRGGDAIHETPPDTYDNVVKENILLKNPETTAATIDRAVQIAKTPPKGPVRVGLPKNYLQMDVPIAGASTPSAPSTSTVPEQAVAEAAEHLLAAEMPVIMAGGGVRASGGTAALRSLAERLDAPVVTTYKGKGVFPEDHDLSAGVLSGSASQSYWTVSPTPTPYSPSAPTLMHTGHAGGPSNYLRRSFTSRLTPTTSARAMTRLSASSQMPRTR